MEKNILTVDQVLKVKATLEKLFAVPAKEVNMKLLRRILRAMKQADQTAAEYTELRNKLIISYDYRDSDGIQRVPKEKEAEFNEKDKELLEADSLVKDFYITGDELESLRKYLSIGHLFLLADVGIIDLENLDSLTPDPEAGNELDVPPKMPRKKGSE